MNRHQTRLLDALRARTDDPMAQLGLIYFVARGIDGVKQKDIEVVRAAIDAAARSESAG